METQNKAIQNKGGSDAAVYLPLENQIYTPQAPQPQAKQLLHPS
jgi:hypothetical protein